MREAEATLRKGDQAPLAGVNPKIRTFANPNRKTETLGHG